MSLVLEQGVWLLISNVRAVNNRQRPTQLQNLKLSRLIFGREILRNLQGVRKSRFSRLL